jgi:hypothetical protein
MKTLLTPGDVDRLLRYPSGRAKRLATANRIPFICLPDGEIRFDQTEIEKLLTPAPDPEEERRVEDVR